MYFKWNERVNSHFRKTKVPGEILHPYSFEVSYSNREKNELFEVINLRPALLGRLG